MRLLLGTLVFAGTAFGQFEDIRFGTKQYARPGYVACPAGTACTDDDRYAVADYLCQQKGYSASDDYVVGTIQPYAHSSRGHRSVYPIMVNTCTLTRSRRSGTVRCHFTTRESRVAVSGVFTSITCVH